MIPRAWIVSFPGSNLPPLRYTQRAAMRGACIIFRAQGLAFKVEIVR